MKRDVDFVRLAGERGWLSASVEEAIVTEADRLQAMGLEKGVDDLLLERRLLSAAQVRELRAELGWSVRQPRVGGYEIVRRIGAGGTGSVFEARHVRLDRRVALKVLFPRLASQPAFRKRFAREALGLARLNHPNLIHVLDAGHDDRYAYLALEFVEGENAAQILARRGRLPWREAIAIALPVCRGLKAMEEKRLLHCDVKPANILLDDSGTVKLVDLGLLAPVDRVDGAEAFLCGSPHYMAPEQILRRSHIDIRSDLYSLGVTWYQLLTGQPPFVSESTRDVLRAHVDQAPPLENFSADTPSVVRNCVVSWLSKSPDDRPADCSRAIEVLEGLLRASPAGRNGVGGDGSVRDDPARDSLANEAGRMGRAVRTSRSAAPMHEGMKPWAPGTRLAAGLLLLTIAGLIVWGLAIHAGRHVEDESARAAGASTQWSAKDVPRVSASLRSQPPRRPSVPSTPTGTGEPSGWTVCRNG